MSTPLLLNEKPSTSLRKLNLVCASIQACLAIGMVTWLSTSKVNEAVFPLESGDYKANGQGDRLFQIPPSALIILLVIFTVVTSSFHILYSMGAADYNKNVAEGKNWMRWVEYSITASIMLLVIALSSGVLSLDSQIFIVTCSVCCMLCGLVAEQMEGPFSIKILVTSIGWILLVVAYFVIFRHFSLSASKAPNFVYAIVISMFIMFVSFGVIHIIHLIRKEKNISIEANRRFEMAYTIDSMISKTLLVSLLFGGLTASHK